MLRRSLLSPLCRQVVRRALIATPAVPRVAVSQSIMHKSHFVRSYSEHSASSTFGNAIPDEVTNLTSQKYHNEADLYMDRLLDGLETLSEDFPDVIPDVELNHGVMTLEITGLGSYVINKQPPNKQIWLASPVSGPDRFDLYQNEWVSLRNGNKLNEVLSAEIKKVLPEVPVDL